jgi:hypothetical protein
MHRGIFRIGWPTFKMVFSVQQFKHPDVMCQRTGRWLGRVAMTVTEVRCHVLLDPAYERLGG